MSSADLSLEDLFSEGAPADLLCPVSQKLMHDPVSVKGKTYDRLSLLDSLPKEIKNAKLEEAEEDTKTRAAVEKYIDDKVEEYFNNAGSASSDEMFGMVDKFLAHVATTSTEPLVLSAQVALFSFVTDHMDAIKDGAALTERDRLIRFLENLALVQEPEARMLLLNLVADVPAFGAIAPELASSFYDSLGVEAMVAKEAQLELAADIVGAFIQTDGEVNVLNQFSDLKAAVFVLRALEKKKHSHLGRVLATLAVFSDEDTADDANAAVSNDADSGKDKDKEGTFAEVVQQQRMHADVFSRLSDDDISFLAAVLQQYGSDDANLDNLYFLLSRHARALEAFKSCISESMPARLYEGLSQQKLWALNLTALLFQIGILHIENFMSLTDDDEDVVRRLLYLVPFSEERYHELVTEMATTAKNGSVASKELFIQFLNTQVLYANVRDVLEVEGIVGDYLHEKPSVDALNVLRCIYVSHISEGDKFKPSAEHIEHLGLEQLCLSEDGALARLAQDVCMHITNKFFDMNVKAFSKDFKVQSRLQQATMRTMDHRVTITKHCQDMKKLKPAKRMEAIEYGLDSQLEDDFENLQEMFLDVLAKDKVGTEDAGYDAPAVVSKTVERIRIVSIGKLAKTLRLLNALLCNESNAKHFIKIKGLQIVLAIVHAHRDNGEILSTAFQVLNTLSSVEGVTAAMAREGGIKASVAALRSHASESPIIVQAATVVANLSNNAGVRSMLVSMGALDVLVKMLKKPTSPEALVAVCNALGNLAYKNELHIRAIGERDAIGMILQNVRAHAKDENVCTAAFGVLNHVTIVPENGAQLGAAGGSKDVVANLKKYGKNIALVGSAFGVMWNLALQKDCRKPLIDEGAIDIILKALSTYVNEPYILRCACSSLSNLALSDVRGAVGAGGGALSGKGGRKAIDAVLNVVRMHKSNPVLMKSAFSALNNISLEKDNKTYIVECGAVTEVLDVAQTHAKETKLLNIACGILVSLAYKNEDNKIRIGKSGAISVVLQLMQLHRGDGHLQEIGCSVLTNLSFNENNRSIILESKGVEVIVTSMMRHMNNPRFLKTACDTLGNMSYRSEKIARAIGGAGGVQACFEVVARFLDLPAVVESAVSTLSALSIKKNMFLFVKASGIRRLSAVCAQYGSAPTVMKSTEVVLSSMGVKRDQIPAMVKRYQKQMEKKAKEDKAKKDKAGVSAATKGVSKMSVSGKKPTAAATKASSAIKSKVSGASATAAKAKKALEEKKKKKKAV